MQYLLFFGKPGIASFIEESSLFVISVPVLYEIYYGFYFPPLSKKFNNNKNFLQKLQNEEKKLLNLLNDINVFNLTILAVKKAAEISALLDSKGNIARKKDILIAGIILSYGYTEILTNNRSHYENIPDLIIHSY